MKIDSHDNPLDKLPETLKRDLGRNLCVCNEVLRIDVINAIVDGARTIEEVRQKTYATDGNGCCKRQVGRLIECIWPHDWNTQDGVDHAEKSTAGQP